MGAAYVLSDATPTAQYELQITENMKRARRNFQDYSARGLLKIIIFGFNPERIFIFFFLIFISYLLPPSPRQVSEFLLLVCVCACSQRGGPHTDPSGSLLPRGERSSVRPRLHCRLPRVSPARAGFACTCKINCSVLLSFSPLLQVETDFGL